MICTGSATGAYSSSGPPNPTPSFALMDIDGGKVGALAGIWLCCALLSCVEIPGAQLCRVSSLQTDCKTRPPPPPHTHTHTEVQATVYVYELVDGQVKVDKLEFLKPRGPAAVVATAAAAAAAASPGRFSGL